MTTVGFAAEDANYDAQYQAILSGQTADTTNLSVTSLEQGDEASLDFEVSSSNTGNIFYNGEIPKLTVKARNAGSVSDSFDITYTVTNRYTGEYFTESDNAYIISKNWYRKELSFENLPYGTYDISIKAVSGSGYESAGKASFSIVSADYSDAERRSDFGVATHIYSREGDVGSVEIPVMARAGFGMVRETLIWRQIETTQGVYSIPKGVNDFLANAEANGIEPLMILGLSNTSVYPELLPFVKDPTEKLTAEKAEADFQEYLKKLYNYCNNVAELLGDRVTYYEIGNEYNHPQTNIDAYPGHGVKNKAADYVRIMEAAYSGIKRGNPNAVVVGGVLAEMNDGTGYYEISSNYVEELYSLGAGKWMDCLSVHFYKHDYFPGESGYKAMEELKAVDDIITANAQKYGDKELWVTEYGWNSPQIDAEKKLLNLEWTQAENLVKSQVLFAKNSLPDKSFWYNFEGTVSQLASEKSTGYGMVESFVDESDLNHTPGRAKGAYLTSSIYNKLMKNCTYIEDKSSGDKQEHIFLDNDSKINLHVLWSLNGDETFTIPAVEGVTLTVTDMFGNISYPELTDDGYSIIVGRAPVYVMPEIPNDNLTLVKDNYSKIRFKGSILTDGPQNIAVALLHPGKTRADFESNPLVSSAYIGHFVTDSEGRYDELIKLGGKDGTYTLLYGVEGEDIRELEITWYKTPYDTELVITQNNSEVDGVKDFDPQLSFDTNIVVNNGRGLPGDCVFITAFYNGDTLVDCKTIKGSVNSEKAIQSFANAEPLSLPEGAKIDKIKLMMIDSLDKLVPLASVKTID